MEKERSGCEVGRLGDDERRMRRTEAAAARLVRADVMAVMVILCCMCGSC